MNHRHVPPSADGSAAPQDHGGHGGWGMAGMMLICCIPMIIVIAVAVASSR
jgi:hypothetical protein